MIRPPLVFPGLSVRLREWSIYNSLGTDLARNKVSSEMGIHLKHGQCFWIHMELGTNLNKSKDDGGNNGETNKDASTLDPELGCIKLNVQKGTQENGQKLGKQIKQARNWFVLKEGQYGKGIHLSMANVSG